jgi:hypothetical protein
MSRGQAQRSSRALNGSFERIQRPSQSLSERRPDTEAYLEQPRARQTACVELEAAQRAAVGALPLRAAQDRIHDPGLERAADIIVEYALQLRDSKDDLSRVGFEGDRSLMQVTADAIGHVFARHDDR